MLASLPADHLSGRFAPHDFPVGLTYARAPCAPVAEILARPRRLASVPARLPLVAHQARSATGLATP